MNVGLSFTGLLTVGDLSGTFQGSFSGTLSPPAAAGPSPRGTPTTGTGPPTLPPREVGDVLVMFCSFASSPGSNLDGLGNWTRLHAISGGGDVFLFVYTRTSDGGADAISLFNQPHGYTVYAAKDATAFDVSAAGTANVGTDCVAPSVTPTAPALLLCGYASTSGAATITPPGGQTASAQVGTLARLRCGTESVAAGATGTRTATLDAAASSIAVSVAVK